MAYVKKNKPKKIDQVRYVMHTRPDIDWTSTDPAERRKANKVLYDEFPGTSKKALTAHKSAVLKERHDRAVTPLRSWKRWEEDNPYIKACDEGFETFEPPGSDVLFAKYRFDIRYSDWEAIKVICEFRNIQLPDLLRTLIKKEIEDNRKKYFKLPKD